jgi:Ca2+/Na+ antiporter
VIALFRLAVIGFVLMTVVYVLVSIYSRSVRREKLEKRWDANPPEGADPAARDAYIEKGMAEYHSGLRRKLIWLVYVVPTMVVIGILIVTNWN